ncbi:hypothetical protein CDD83_6170 [Cordyceps sp. RAO-2017]|nr:hypothetical protein CDD83_6170 [Cordyceps sp. RAO-2017]
MADSDQTGALRRPLLGAAPSSSRTFASQSVPRAAALPSTPAAAAWGGGIMSPEARLRSAPTSPPDDFWRLLPVAESSRRNSAAAAEGPRAPDRKTPSWAASTPSPTETVKRSPLTPFPSWEMESGGRGTRVTERQPQQAREAQQHREPDAAHFLLPIGGGFLERRANLNTVMHGVALVGQAIVALAVSGALLAMTVWEKGGSQSYFWKVLWTYVQPCVGLVFAACAAALVLHETRVLSAVAMLYVEAAILTMTMATSLALGLCVATHNSSQGVKGVVAACVTLMMGTAVLAFFRVVLVWWLVEDGDELGGQTSDGGGERHASNEH